MIGPAVLDELKGIVGADGVLFRPELFRPEDMLVYECDGRNELATVSDANPQSVMKLTQAIRKRHV
jgi:hypothetical protein